MQGLRRRLNFRGLGASMRRMWQWAGVPAVRTPLRQAQVLIDTSRAIADVPDVVQLMTTVLDQLHRVVPSTSAAIHMIEDDTQRLVAARMFHSTAPPIGSSWLRDALPLTKEIGLTHRPVVVIDVRLDPRWVWMEGVRHVRSWMGVPLLAQDELLGFLLLDRDEPVGFRSNEVDTAMAVAAQLALALRLAYLATSRQRQLADLAALYALSRTAGASLHPDQLLPALAQHLQTLVGVPICLIMLLDEDGNVQPAAAAGVSLEEFRQRHITSDGPCFGCEIIRQQVPILIADTSDSKLLDPDILALTQAHSLLGLPLMVQAVATGAVIFGDFQQPHRFSAELIKHAEVAAGHAALAIVNSRLFEATQRYARELALRDRVRMAVAAAPPELAALAHQVTTSLAETFGYTYVDCWEPNDDRLVLISTLATNPIAPEVTLPLNYGICGQVARTGVACLVEDVQTSSIYASYAGALRRTHDQGVVPAIVSAMCVPVSRADQVVLVLNIEHVQLLGEPDLRMVTDIAAQVGLALEHVQLLKEMQRVQADLAQTARMAAVGTLAAGVAHEFNNMLAAMVGYAQLGLIGSTEEQTEAFEVVLTMAQRGKALTGSLLSFAAAESYRRLVMPLDDLIDQGLELVEPDLQRLAVTIRRQRDERVMVSVDPPQLVQVVIHLLTNARDAMPTGGELLIRTTIRESLAEFVINDTGSGIPPAVRERLFEPFVTTKGVFGGGDQEGVGLGLSICYAIVHGHGGTIEVESPREGGSTFIVRLPLHIEEGDAAPADVLVPSKRRTLRVLVVDDDSLIQALLRTTLIRAGYFVLFASDAEGARVLVHQGGLDVIVCSLSLPGVDGLEFAQQLYAEGWRIPFVLMTGRIDGPGLARARGEPIASILLKPFQAHEVLSILKAVVAGTRTD